MAVPVVRFPIFPVVRMIGIAVASLVLIWTVHYRGGLALISENKDLIFNVHPVLMVISLVILNGEVYVINLPIVANCHMRHISVDHECTRVRQSTIDVYPRWQFTKCSMLAYKTVSGTKSFKKLVHLFLQFLAFCLSIVGLWAAWKFHVDKGIDNFYSLHSWLGLACLAFFGIQWAAGFATFWYPGGSRNTRASLLPWHVYFGIYIYALAVATCATGFLEKVTFLQTQKIITRYSAEALLVNSLGILVVVLAGFVILGVVSPVNGKGDIPRNVD